jgi:hypothetical protein
MMKAPFIPTFISFVAVICQALAGKKTVERAATQN